MADADEMVFNMKNLAKMATMQEHLTQKEDAAFDHKDAVLSVFQYHGRKLEQQVVAAESAPEFLATLHSTVEVTASAPPPAPPPRCPPVRPPAASAPCR